MDDRIWDADSELHAEAETERERHRRANGSPETADPVNDEAEVARLARLSHLDYEREREPAADRLGCRVSILDRLVDAKRSNGANPGNGTGHLSQGRPLNLPEIVPWPRSVDGAVLLGGLARAIRRYVVLAPHEADAVALWLLETHAFDAWVIFPRLFITAAERGCGKSTLLDVLSRLVPAPLGASSISAAALFRVIEAVRPTLLLDEADAYARDNEELRAVLDARHRRDGFVIRSVGDNHDPRQFSVWAPVALAAIGHLPGTVEDRSIFVRLRRRRFDEPIQSFRLDRVPRLEVLARMVARWSVDHMAALAAADPAMPAGIYNRDADNWRPLLAVADLAGGLWPARSRCAVVASSGYNDDSASVRVLLLGDLREMFAGEPMGVLFTSEILAALHQREDRPWPEYRGGRPMTPRQMATLLRPLGISTNQTVRRGTTTGKGYRAAEMTDAWSRYLRPDASVTESHPAGLTDFGESASVTLDRDVADPKCSEASDSAACDRVTGRLGGEPAEWTL